MFRHEIDLGGVYVAPFAGSMLIGLLLFVMLRVVLRRTGLTRWAWHLALFETALLASVVALVALAG